MRVFANLRYTVETRRKAVMTGLKNAGFDQIVWGLPSAPPEKGDVLLTWNRIGAGNSWARRFEKFGLPVIVIENATWGNDFAGQRWYHLACSYHNTAGCFPVGSPARWSSLGVNFQPWRLQDEIVILPQRGIGSEPTKMPYNFLMKARKRFPTARIRKHPGARGKVISLEKDLANAGHVVTWGSGAAVKALVWGIPVTSYMPNWIAEQGNTDTTRQQMFERLAWAQWTIEEITSGEPFRRLLEFHRGRS